MLSNLFQTGVLFNSAGDVVPLNNLTRNAGLNADMVDGEHNTAFAHRQIWNNMIHSGNEYTWIAPQYSGIVWINYRTSSGSADGNITEYWTGNGAASLAYVRSLGFIKNGYNNTYLLQAGGGAKLESDLSVNSAINAGNADTVDTYHLEDILKKTPTRNLIYRTPIKGGRTTVDGYSIKATPASNQGDTYFYITPIHNLEPGKYIFSFSGTGFSGTDHWVFAWQNNSNLGYVDIKNGRACGIITVSATINAGTNILIDDIGSGSAINSANVTLYDFSLVKYDSAEWYVSPEEVFITSLSSNNDTNLTITTESGITKTLTNLYAKYLNGYSSSDFLYTTQVSSPQDSTYGDGPVTWAQTYSSTRQRSYIYNTYGVEYSYLFGMNTNNNYGTILKIGYSDRYLRILRKSGGNWQSTDWEKIYSGYADSAGNADKLDGYDYNNLPYVPKLAWHSENSGESVNDLVCGTSFYYTTHGAPTHGVVASFTGTHNSYQLQIQGKYYGKEFWYRSKNGDNGTWNAWTQVIDTNNIGSQSVTYAGSAGQLSTTRYIYGNAFNGTQNVSGNFNMSTGDQLNMTGADWDGFAFNYASGKSGGQSTRFYNGASTEIVRFTAGGNVGIGTTSPSYKLTVSGSIFGDSITMGEASGYFRYRTASSLESGFYFHSSGRESVVFANEYAHTGWIFVNGIKPSNRTQWNALGVTPALQIHHNAIYVNRAVRDADTSDYNLYVGGTVYTTDRYCFPQGGSTYSWNRINEGYNRTSIRAYSTAGQSATGARDNYSIGLMIDGYYSFALAGYGGGATLAWRNNSGTWYDIITSQNIGSQHVSYADSAGNADTLDNINSTGFLAWTGMSASGGSSAPFQTSVDFFNNTANLNAGARMIYNYPGNEYTILYTRRSDATGHGSILRWGYPDNYIRMIRMVSGSPQTSDWEKISAGYADSAGNSDTVDGYHASSFSLSSHNHDGRYSRTHYSFAAGSDNANTTCTDLGTWVSKLNSIGGISNYGSISIGAWWWVRSTDLQVNGWNIRTSGGMTIYGGSGDFSSGNYHHFLVLDAYSDLYGITSNETSWKYYRRFLNNGNYTDYVNTTNFPGLNSTGTVTSVTVQGSNGISGSGTVTTSGTITLSASYLPTCYVGGQKTNPQTYFSNTIGLRVAMTGSWSVWSDTLWINGYSGGDVKSMCALHFLRNGTPRMAISCQNHDATSYGTYYEVITAYNIGNQSVAYATSAGSATDSSKVAKTGDTMTGPLTLYMGHDRKLYINNADDELYWSLISFQQKGTEYGILGTSGSTDLKWNNNVILHSGNWSSYISTSSVSVSNSNPGLGKSSATIATINGTAITAYVSDSDKVDGLHVVIGAPPSSPDSNTIYIVV